MTPLLFVCAFFLYSVLVYAIKRILYPFDMEPACPCIMPWRKGQEHALFVSPDYWWAFRFKSRIADKVDLACRAEVLKAYVIANNTFNVRFSGVLVVLCLVTALLDRSSSLFQLLSAIAVVRMLSRSYEIAYAFGRDVLQQEPSATGLKKNERVRLALLSYFEIFLYSAAAYTCLPTVGHALDAITLALNVGTLTNVGYAFAAKDVTFVVNLVFVQVITTLSLVVLSLASYLSRNEDA